MRTCEYLRIVVRGTGSVKQRIPRSGTLGRQGRNRACFRIPCVASQGQAGAGRSALLYHLLPILHSSRPPGPLGNPNTSAGVKKDSLRQPLEYLAAEEFVAPSRAGLH
ncbi:hypothetical protein GN956_G9509 [Arapaima gigas]